MNKITYKIVFSFDLSEAINSVGNFTKSINSNLAKFGVNEKISIRSKSFSMNLQCDRELTKQERETMKETLVTLLNAKIPYNFKIESFRRQSCNKSCSQSRNSL